MLVLTNLSWARNPYANPIRPRPNARLFGPTVFNFLEIQTRRVLAELEVQQINFVLKKRALRFVAAAVEDWLYSEAVLPVSDWSRLGEGYLFMPDPRSMSFSSEVAFGYESGPPDKFDEYGRVPGDSDFGNQAMRDREWDSFQAFKGEFARKFGPRRRGRSFQAGRLDNEVDDPDSHKHHLDQEAMKPQQPQGAPNRRKRRTARKRKRRH